MSESVNSSKPRHPSSLGERGSDLREHAQRRAARDGTGNELTTHPREAHKSGAAKRAVEGEGLSPGGTSYPRKIHLVVSNQDAVGDATSNDGQLWHAHSIPHHKPHHRHSSVHRNHQHQDHHRNHHHHHIHHHHHQFPKHHSHHVSLARDSFAVRVKQKQHPHAHHLKHMHHKTVQLPATDRHAQPLLNIIESPATAYDHNQLRLQNPVTQLSYVRLNNSTEPGAVHPARLARAQPYSLLGSMTLGAASVSSDSRLLNQLLLIAFPICAFLMLSLIFLLVIKYCKRLKRACKNRKKSSTQQTKKGLNKMRKFISAPIGFISNGKVVNCTNGGSDLLDVKMMTSKEALGQAKAAAKDQEKALDCRQLTINMIEADVSVEASSDEQQKPPKEETKFSGHLKLKQTKRPIKPGMLKYGLEYDFNQSILSVSVFEGRELPPMDLNGQSDPYVCVFMSNNKNYPMFKTKIHKHTLNPVFNETFKYQITYPELTKQTLILSVYDYDRLSKHDEIGQLTLPMNSIDLAERQVHWCDLHKMNDATDGRLGDICLSLRYVPTAGRLNVVILEARQLKKMDLAGLSDPYVKIALINNGKRLKKKKTSIKKCTLNPHYNESFSFEIPFEQAQEVQLAITVVDYDRIGTSEPIGKVTLGCLHASGETELRHWMDMLASPRRPIARWHCLKNIEGEPKMSRAQTRRFSQLITNKTRD